MTRDRERDVAVVVAWRSIGPEATKRDERLSETEHGLIRFLVSPIQTLGTVLRENRRIRSTGFGRKSAKAVPER